MTMNIESVIEMFSNNLELMFNLTFNFSDDDDLNHIISDVLCTKFDAAIEMSSTICYCAWAQLPARWGQG